MPHTFAAGDLLSECNQLIRELRDGSQQPTGSQHLLRGGKREGTMGVAEVRRLKQLEEENKKLKQLVADLSLDKKMLQDVVQGKV
ncbi:hypothetical protein [Gimesia fumaroli]|uniref:Transposase n=1 Tax=Gimesia fumaroli TaxID=2527976 RepID=A0A518IJ12_9PLAN|nr:hypothetical protein [Gimesia fumaroli]QDV53083.1 hypothetical protein Enr17x_51540 [Gimesia fumaroli]